jgi:uncharacterized protein (DUF983 family)
MKYTVECKECGKELEEVDVVDGLTDEEVDEFIAESGIRTICDACGSDQTYDSDGNNISHE